MRGNPLRLVVYEICLRVSYTHARDLSQSAYVSGIGMFSTFAVLSVLFFFCLSVLLCVPTARKKLASQKRRLNSLGWSNVSTVRAGKLRMVYP